MEQFQILMKIDKLDIIGLEIHQFHQLQKLERKLTQILMQSLNLENKS